MSEPNDPMAAVRQYIDAFNRGDVDVKGDFGYVVVPTTMTFDLKGQQIVQNGGVFTVALRNGDDGWRLAAWAWSKGSNSPA